MGAESLWENLTIGHLLTLAGLVFVYINLNRTGQALIAAAERRITSLETKGEILWTFFSELNKKTAALLISPHTPELDKLLQKWIDEEELDEHDLTTLLNYLREEERVTALENGLRRLLLALQITSVEARLKACKREDK